MYDIDFKKKGEYVLHLKKFFLYPQFWEDPLKNLNEPTGWNKVKFTKLNRSRIPKVKGVYCFVLQPKSPRTSRNILFRVSGIPDIRIRK